MKMDAVFEPFVGPRPYEETEEDRALFFGRDREVSELLSLIVAQPVVLLYAQSGAGKTSLINAKLIPALKDDGYEVLPTARVQGIDRKSASNIFVYNTLVSWTEGEDSSRLKPRAEAASVGRPGKGQSRSQAAPDLSNVSSVDFLRERPHFASPEGWDLPRFAFFDQFEELFTFYPHRWKDRQGFFEQVRDALEEDPLLRVVFAMREDYIAELHPYASLLPEKLRTRFRLQRLRENAALSAITNPLQMTTRRFGEGVAEQLVQNLLKIPGRGDGESEMGQAVEPVQLQVVCQNLWQSLAPGDEVITAEHLESCGDVTEALSAFYERSIKTVVQETGVRQGDLRRWFGNTLITAEGTRGLVFAGREKAGEMPIKAVARLEELHLIKSEPRGGARWIELTHDRFIEPIRKSNERWLAERSGGEDTRLQLEAKAGEWVRLGRGTEGLLDEGELLVARRWLESPEAADVGYSEALFALVQASRAAIDEANRERERAIEHATQRERELEYARTLGLEQQRRLRQFRIGLVAVCVLLAGMVGMTLFAFHQRARAKESEGIAMTNFEQARAAEGRAVVALEVAEIARAGAERDKLAAEYQSSLAVEREYQAQQARRAAVAARELAETRRREIEQKSKDNQALVGELDQEQRRRLARKSADTLTREADRLRVTSSDSRRVLAMLNDALRLYDQAGERESAARTLIGIGQISRDYLGQKEEALRVLSESLSRWRAINDAAGIVDSLNEIIKTYDYMRQPRQSLNYLLQVLEAVQLLDPKDYKGAAVTYDNIAKRYLTLGDRENAITKYKSAQNYYHRAGKPNNEAAMFYELANIYAGQADAKEKKKALEFFERALSLYQETKSLTGQVKTLNRISTVYAALGMTNEALDYRTRAAAFQP
jgi:tetratricopeptide (TPR) repeat protein